MAKGDTSRVQNAIDSQYNNAQNRMENMWARNYGQYDDMYPRYQRAANVNLNNYDEMMNNYRNFLGQGQRSQGQQSQQQGRQPPEGYNPQQSFMDAAKALNMTPAQARQNMQPIVDYLNKQSGGNDWEWGGEKAGDYLSYRGTGYDVIPAGDANFQWTLDDPGTSGQDSQFMGDYGALGPALEKYKNFAETGGFSPEDLANIRARSISPTRSIYSSAQDELSRAKNLQGGYMPNYGAASAKMARNMSQRIGDINTDVNAAIAQMTQQGKMFGTSGLSNMGLTGRSQALQGLSGMSGLYGTTPGLTNMFGNQALQSSGQGIDIAGLQNQLANNRVNAQLGKAKMPAWWDTALDVAGKAGGIIEPFL